MIVKTYSSLWKIPRKIRSIERYRLPRPITYPQAGFFVLGVLFVYFIKNYFPVFFLNNAVLEYLVIPVLFTIFMTKKKYDGKAPHKFIFSMCRYLVYAHRMNRYHVVDKQNKYKFDKPVFILNSKEVIV